MYDLYDVDVKSLNRHSNFPFLKVEWYITKNVSALMIGFKNHMGLYNVINKRRETGIIHIFIIFFKGPKS